jgi:hypothetical protein
MDIRALQQIIPKSFAYLNNESKRLALTLDLPYKKRQIGNPHAYFKEGSSSGSPILWQ